MTNETSESWEDTMKDMTNLFGWNEGDDYL
jgi:hypothetical protein